MHWLPFTGSHILEAGDRLVAFRDHISRKLLLGGEGHACTGWHVSWARQVRGGESGGTGGLPFADAYRRWQILSLPPVNSPALPYFFCPLFTRLRTSGSVILSLAPRHMFIFAGNHAPYLNLIQKLHFVDARDTFPRVTHVILMET
jgi:hypothetical protein